MIASGGYGVVQAEVAADSELAGKTLAQTDLRQRGITVLVIRRDASALANPPTDSRIEAGDFLLCFGKRERLREQFGSPTGDGEADDAEPREEAPAESPEEEGT